LVFNFLGRITPIFLFYFNFSFNFYSFYLIYSVLVFFLKFINIFVLLKKLFHFCFFAGVGKGTFFFCNLERILTELVV
jgi:hypothetical protein